MLSIGSGDFLSFSLRGKLGESSLDSLSFLYAPLCGAASIGVYLSFYGFAEKKRVVYPAYEVVKATGLSYHALVEAMKPLEALGLLSTTAMKGGDGRTAYTVAVYPPCSPKAFFADTLLVSELQSTLGEEGVARIRKDLAPDPLPLEGQNVSTTFQDFFRPSYRLEAFANAYAPLAEDAPRPLRTGFDRSLFFEAFSRLGFTKEMLSEGELSFIAKAGALYDYASDVLGEFAADSLSNQAPFGKKLNQDLFLKKCRESLKLPYLKRKPSARSGHADPSSDLSKRVAMMDSTPSARWLSIKQKGHVPAPSDLKILEKLTIDMGLPEPCCNALIDYVLAINHNVFSAPLAEKIAASLVREGFDNARDAMDYLVSKKRNPQAKATPAAREKTSNEPETAEISPEELDALFESAYKKKGN